MNEKKSITNDNLKKRTITGVFWKGSERLLAQLVSVIVSIILARILVPEDYSVISIVTIFFAFCNIIVSGGLSTSLIQKKNPDTIDFSTILISNLVLATILYVSMFFCAPLLAKVYNKPILTPVIRIMAITFFINGYKSVLNAKIVSDLEFKKFFWSTLIGTIISAVVGILMALRGFGVWSLVVQQMTNSFVDSIILTFSSKIKLRVVFSKERFKSLFKFGGKIMLSSIISEAYNQTKPIIVGLKYSTLDLAYYNKGRTYPALFSSISNDTLSSALFPSMAKVQDDKEAILNITRRFIQLSSFVVFPIMVGFLAVSEGFVKIILTEKWLPIVPYLMIFCVSEMFKPIQTGNLQAIRAIGRSDVFLKLEIFKKISYLIVIVLFLFLTNSPILLAVSGIITSLLASIINSIPNRRLLGYTFFDQLSDVFLNLITSSIMGVAVFFMKYIPLNIYLVTSIQIVTGFLLYFILNLIFLNKNLFVIIRFLRKILKNTNRKKSKQ